MSPKVATVTIHRGRTYELLAIDTGEEGIPPTAILCLACGHTSYHPMDVRELYCGYCHKFHAR